MGRNTLIKKRSSTKHTHLVNCHGGKGSIDLTEVLVGKNTKLGHIRFFHDDVLPPGASVGIHHHENDEEYYYILSGKGVMTLDGEQFEVEEGDLTAVYPGGTHGLENNSHDDLHVIVICIYPH